jgi:hypothetical protein
MGEMRNAYWWQSQKARDHWENQDVGGWTILKWILEIGWDGVDWIDMAQDRDKWKSLVNTVFEPSGSMKSWKVLELLSFVSK